MGRHATVDCPRCGAVAVAVEHVEIHANRREDLVLFAVPCPSCDELIVGGDRELIAALEQAGARQLELRSTSPPPLTTDDLLDLHLWLRTDPDFSASDSSTRDVTPHGPA